MSSRYDVSKALVAAGGKGTFFWNGNNCTSTSPLPVVETNAYALRFYFISLFVTVQTRASTTLMR